MNVPDQQSSPTAAERPAWGARPARPPAGTFDRERYRKLRAARGTSAGHRLRRQLGVIRGITLGLGLPSGGGPASTAVGGGGGLLALAACADAVLLWRRARRASERAESFRRRVPSPAPATGS